MSDLENQTDETIDTPNEKTMLMQRARLMNLKFSNNISLEKLREKVNAATAGETVDDDADADNDGHDDATGEFVDGNQEAANQTEELFDAPVETPPALQTTAEAVAPVPTPAPEAPLVRPVLEEPVAPRAAAPARKLTKAEHKQAVRAQLVKDEMKLIRVRITNLNPSKKELPGEVFAVGNRFLGTVKMFVPYGEVSDNGWHIPKIIYDQLLERRFQSIRTTKDKRTGAPRVDSSWAREFALEVLPPLTEQELRDLAIAQAAAGSVD